MRVAVIQLVDDGQSRTALLQSALDGIDEAAEQIPPPDLVVLPAFADIARTRSGDITFVERIEGPTSAACAQRARSWGIFVAFGMAARDGGQVFAASLLLDSDGDIRLQHRQTGNEGVKHLCSGKQVKSAETILGRLVLLCCEEIYEPECWAQAAAAGAKLIVGTHCGCGPERALEMANLSRAHRMPAAIANMTIKKNRPESQGGSLILDSTGARIAEVANNEYGVMATTLDLTNKSNSRLS
ncbi:MAG: carbon-nitrogen hydrolase family protein [Planctomycetes bacterium]|nr:carbon-nitrogen hydrolase family protein [Planctomycetota bacterium]